jgi:hypothetical protein
MAESVEHYVVSDEEWANYKKKFGKNYEAHEEANKLVVKSLIVSSKCSLFVQDDRNGRKLFMQ